MREKVDFKHNGKTYWNLVKTYKWLYLIIFLTVLFLSGIRLAEKYMFKLIIDNGTELSNGTLSALSYSHILLIILGVFAVTTVFKTVLNWYQLYVVNRLDASVIFDLKSKFFKHIIGLSHSFHTTHKTGSLISRMTRGARAIERMTDFLIFNFIPLFVQVAVTSFALLYLDFASAIVISSVTLVFIAFSIFISYIQQSTNLAANDAEDFEKANISDIFTNIDSVRYFGKDSLIKQKYTKLANDTRHKYVKLWDFGNWFSAGQTIILGIGTATLLIFPLIRFLQGELTIGSVAFIYAVYLDLMSPLYGFVHSIRGFYESIADFQALFAYDKIKNDIVDKDKAPKLNVKEGKVEFKNIKFKYRNRNIVDGLSLKINPGEKIAVVGLSGSGKTTLIKLLYRLYDVQEGEILIDGKNIKDFQQESLRGELSIVPQECILFDDTIYNNIAFSRPGASENEIKRVIRFAQLDKFISSLPEKEKTIVGERGIKLSGGEKQRVSIARALLADKRILVLDEATSSLDSKTEHEIQHDLERLMKGRTSIIIAHRLSTIMGADRIIVMSKGNIAQIGKHSELIKKNGVYRQLWDLQKGGYLSNG